MTLINQPTSKTNRKVVAASTAAAFVAPLSTICAGLVTSLWLPQMVEFHLQIELLISLSLTGLATWVAGYQTRERG